MVRGDVWKTLTIHLWFAASYSLPSTQAMQKYHQNADETPAVRPFLAAIK